MLPPYHPSFVQALITGPIHMAILAQVHMQQTKIIMLINTVCHSAYRYIVKQYVTVTISIFKIHQSQMMVLPMKFGVHANMAI
ncbi:hypothetical protein D9M71_312630 [compost metagenome]